MKDEQPPLFLQRSVPVDEAVVRTTNWRALYKDVTKCEECDILRAYFIPIEDIISLYEFYKKHKVMIKGVRGYLGHNPLDPINPTVLETDLMLCPVDLEGNDIITPPPSLQGVLGTDGSTIYDFSTPCPNMCDTNSVLYSDTNLQKK